MIHDGFYRFSFFQMVFIVNDCFFFFNEIFLLQKFGSHCRITDDFGDDCTSCESCLICVSV